MSAKFEPAATVRVSRKKAPNLKARTARLAEKPGTRAFAVLGDGIALGYHRPKTPTLAGQWLVRRRQPDGTYALATIGAADDFDAPDGMDILDYTQAIARALGKARDPAATTTITVQAACDTYCKALEARRGRAASEARSAFKKHLGTLAARKVKDLTEEGLRRAVADMPARIRSNLKAALNALPTAARPPLPVTRALNGGGVHKAPTDAEGRAIGVDEVPDAARTAEIVAAARKHGNGFGRFVATLQATGCRPGQVALCRVKDLQHDAILLVPPSQKGRPGRPKPWARRPLPQALSDELRTAAKGRKPDSLLFWLPLSQRDTTPKDEGGTGWKLLGEQPWHRVAWARAARGAGIGEGLYQLRHAAVVRMLLRGVPLRLIAASLDTSTAMLERVYSRWIGAHGEDLLRADADAL